MNLRTITFTFPRDLTQAQEDTLISGMQHIRDGIDKRLEGIQTKLESSYKIKLAARMSSMSRSMIEACKAKIPVIRKQLGRYFKLDKTDNHTYVFKYAFEELKILKNNPLAMNIAGYQLFNGDVVSYKKMEPFFKIVFVKMGFQTSEVIVTEGEDEVGDEKQVEREIENRIKTEIAEEVEHDGGNPETP